MIFSKLFRKKEYLYSEVYFLQNKKIKAVLHSRKKLSKNNLDELLKQIFYHLSYLSDNFKLNRKTDQINFYVEDTTHQLCSEDFIKIKNKIGKGK